MGNDFQRDKELIVGWELLVGNTGNDLTHAHRLALFHLLLVSEKAVQDRHTMTQHGDIQVVFFENANTLPIG
jgi:hypothetical protein